MSRGVQRAGVLVLLVLAGWRLAADPVALQDRQHLADGLFRRGLFDLAAREYAVLAQAPDMPALDDVLFRLAECQRRLKHTAEAEAAYKRLVEACPASPHVARARLQRALILAEGGAERSPEAEALLRQLIEPTVSADVRAAALYHLGELLERVNRAPEALAIYEKLGVEFADTAYGMYSGLRTAWLLTQSAQPENSRRAMGIYLELAYKATDAKVAEEAFYFAAIMALREGRYEESARLFQHLKNRFPSSSRVVEGALSAGWANYYAGRFKEGAEILELVSNAPKHAARAEILYVKANCLRQLEQRAEALQWYTRLLEEFPQGRLADLAWYEKFATLFRDGQYAAVLSMSAQRPEPPADFADHVFWLNSEAAILNKQPEVAVQNCRLLVDKYPQSAFFKDALYRLGWLLQKQEAWESASGWFLQLVARFPEDPLAARALYASGVCRARLGQSEEALRDWTALLTKYPASEEVAETLYQRSMEELRVKRLRAAAATLDERIRRFPQDARQAEVLYWRASVARQVEDWVEAERLFRACLEAKPSKEFERESMLELGMMLQQRGRTREAAELFQRLLDAPIAEKLGPERLAWLAAFQLEQKMPEAALKAAQGLIALKPDRGWLQTAWTIIGRVHLFKSERDPAIQAFQEALKTGAKTAFGAESALRLGELLTQVGRFEEAAQHLTDAATRASASDMLGLRAHAYIGLARNAEQCGDAEGALRYYMSVGILFDDAVLVPEALHKAAGLLERAGRSAEAQAVRAELKTRYPESPLAKDGQAGTAPGRRKVST